MKSLNDTLAYENTDLLVKFREFYDFSEEEGEYVFTELKKWLWIKALHIHERALAPDNERLDFHFHVFPGLRIVDELWHVFILFTEAYQSFCLKHFDVFVHHTPSLPHKKLPEVDYRAELERELTFIANHLDLSTLELWVAGLKTRFPETLINSKYVYRRSAVNLNKGDFYEVEQGI